MAEQDKVGAALKAGMVLAAALTIAATLPGAFLFALGNMAFNAQWLALLATGGACVAVFVVGATVVAVVGWEQARPFLRRLATIMVIGMVAVSCALTPGG